MIMHIVYKSVGLQREDDVCTDAGFRRRGCDMDVEVIGWEMSSGN